MKTDLKELLMLMKCWEITKKGKSMIRLIVLTADKLRQTEIRKDGSRMLRLGPLIIRNQVNIISQRINIIFIKRGILESKINTKKNGSLNRPRITEMTKVVVQIFNKIAILKVLSI